MRQEHTRWDRSVAGVVLREGKVLLVRHTYGVRRGQLVIPGGYVLEGESPEDAVRRELMEETGVSVEPEGVIGIRFNQKDWYVAFRARYVSGTARSDGDENSEAVWIDASEALSRSDVPDLSRKLIARAAGGGMLARTDYDGTLRYGPYTFYATRREDEEHDSSHRTVQDQG